SDYARTLQPDPWTPPPAIYYKLRHALERRDDLLKMATQESNRLHALQHDPYVPKDILTQIRRHIATLKRQAQAYLKQIEHLLTDHSEWHIAAERLLSIPGMGSLTTAWTLVITHAFTRCDTPQQAAALAGVVPHHRRSGTSLNRRSHIAGGHPKWRKTLYMAAGACIQFNPPLKAFFDKKVAQGKTKQIARIAVARKLVHIAWACVTKDRDFDPNYQRSIQAA
ncbi:MAG TPA: transposase, partial [Candidatus Obscuribacterales bacterium]